MIGEMLDTPSPARRIVFLAAALLVACSSGSESPDAASSAPDAARADAGSADAGRADGGAVGGPDASLAPADAGWTPPYALPASGTTIPIPTSGRNVANDVRPAAHDPGSWQYALFQSYGGGSFSADYSAAGAYVLAGMGGHGASPCFGAAIFDFTTGAWSYLPNGNGFDEARTNDVSRTAETNGWPYLELTQTTAPEMPAPAHNYLLQISPPASVLGGPRGAVLRTVGAAEITEGWDSPQAHAIDLQTGRWTRAASNLVTAVYDGTPYTDTSAAYDPKTKRVYFLLGEFASAWRLAYLDLVDRQWKRAATFTEPGGAGWAVSTFVDEARRLLVVVRSSGTLWAFDLEDLAAGPVPLTVDAAVPAQRVRWEPYPISAGGDGAFYAFSGDGPVYLEGQPPPKATLQALYKLTPPASQPLTGTWRLSTVPVSGGLTAFYKVDAGSGAHHYSRFFFVPALRCFAWIPNGSGAVELVKP